MLICLPAGIVVAHIDILLVEFCQPIHQVFEDPFDGIKETLSFALVEGDNDRMLLQQLIKFWHVEMF